MYIVFLTLASKQMSLNKFINVFVFFAVLLLLFIRLISSIKTNTIHIQLHISSLYIPNTKTVGKSEVAVLMVKLTPFISILSKLHHIDTYFCKIHSNIFFTYAYAFIVLL